MTNKEAIRILNPETSEEALKELEYYRCGLSSESIRENALHTALKMAIEALEKQTKTKVMDSYQKTGDGICTAIKYPKCPECGEVEDSEIVWMMDTIFANFAGNP